MLGTIHFWQRSRWGRLRSCSWVLLLALPLELVAGCSSPGRGAGPQARTLGLAPPSKSAPAEQKIGTAPSPDSSPSGGMLRVGMTPDEAYRAVGATKVCECPPNNSIVTIVCYGARYPDNAVVLDFSLRGRFWLEGWRFDDKPAWDDLFRVAGRAPLTTAPNGYR
jgi:hypothetical protein